MTTASKVVSTVPKTVKWKPTMTQAEADAWAKNSAIKQEFYHGTTASHTQKIKQVGFKIDEGIANQINGKCLGPGHYFGQENVAARYAQKGLKPIKVKINVTNPITEKKLDELATQANRLLYTSKNYAEKGMTSYSKALKEATRLGNTSSMRTIKKAGEKMWDEAISAYSKFKDASNHHAASQKVLNSLIKESGYDYLPTAPTVSADIINGKLVQKTDWNLMVVFDDKKITVIK
jgi:hypothetical protein